MISIDKAKGVAVILPPPLEKCAPQGRKHLSADALLELLRRSFEKIPDHRGRKCPISLADALMSAFAMFSLKDPSLLAFEERRNDENMRNLFRIDHIPSDTHLREILDPVEPRQLRPLFDDLFRQLQRGKALSAVPSRREERGKQAGAMGKPAVPLSPFSFQSMRHLQQVMLYDLAKNIPAPTLDTR
jgi:hypothetical protein